MCLHCALLWKPEFRLSGTGKLVKTQGQLKDTVAVQRGLISMHLQPNEGENARSRNRSEGFEFIKPFSLSVDFHSWIYHEARWPESMKAIWTTYKESIRRSSNSFTAPELFKAALLVNMLHLFSVCAERKRRIVLTHLPLSELWSVCLVNIPLESVLIHLSRSVFVSFPVNGCHRLVWWNVATYIMLDWT